MISHVSPRSPRSPRFLRLPLLALAAMLLVGCGFNPNYEKAQGFKAYERGDYLTAAGRYEPVTDQYPSDWEAHYYLGMCYLELGKPVQAQTELEQALITKEYSSVWTQTILDSLAEAYFRQDRLDAMYGFLQAQIDKYGTWQDYARQARYMAKAGDIDGAALAYRKAAFFSRNQDAAIYIEIADFYASIADYNRAKQSLRYAYFLDEGNAGIEDRFRRLGVVPGPTTREQPPQPEYEGDKIFPF